MTGFGDLAGISAPRLFGIREKKASALHFCIAFILGVWLSVFIEARNGAALQKETTMAQRHFFSRVSGRHIPDPTLVSLDEALSLLSMKRIEADYADGMLFDCRTGHDICRISRNQVPFDVVEAYAWAA